MPAPVKVIGPRVQPVEVFDGPEIVSLAVWKATPPGISKSYVPMPPVPGLYGPGPAICVPVVTLVPEIVSPTDRPPSATAVTFNTVLAVVAACVTIVPGLVL